MHRNLIQVLHDVVAHWNTVITPVHVFSTLRNYPFEETGFQVRHAAQSALAQRLGKISGLPLLPVRLLESPDPSLKSTVDKLCDYARESRADLIVTNTHGQTGLRNVFLGSFAETLLLRSTVPVLTVNPRFRKVRPIHRILFPSGFGPQSHPMFREAVDIAKHLGAKITIFHALPHPVEPYSKLRYIPKAHRDFLLDYVQEQTAKSARRARAWASWAKNQGVRVDFRLKAREGSLWKLIADQANRSRASLIVMEAQSGPLSSRIFDSTIRQLARHSHCPVWILSATSRRQRVAPTDLSRKRAA